MQSTENMEKWKFWFVKVLTRSQVFHKKFLLDAFSAYLFNFLFSRSTFRFYSLYAIISRVL